MIITIDGPVASGKSTVARLLAQKLGFYYLYTGMLYRGLAYILATEYGYDDAHMQQPQIKDIQDITEQHDFEYRYINGRAHVFFDDVDITSHLKSAEVDKWSSMMSAHQHVRDAVLEHQVKIGAMYDTVAEGRDTGSVVFPHAEYKFFLTASQEVRARRWQDDQKRRGKHYTFEESLAAVVARDQRDIERQVSPLVQAHNVVVIDNSDLDIQQTVKKIASYISLLE